MVSISASCLDVKGGSNDTAAFQLQFSNGSIATISYFSNGNPHLPKERIEVFGSGIVTVIEDFKTMTVYSKSITKETITQDKGHAAGVKAFLNAVNSGSAAPIPFDEIDLVMRSTFAVLESIAMNGALIRL